MSTTGFGLRAENVDHLLQARPPLAAFQALDEWLVVVERSFPESVSAGLKAQFFPALLALKFRPEPDWIRLYSLESLAAGLLCGGLDGLALYRQGNKPEPVDHPVGDLLAQAVEVADGEWRLLDADTLQLQAGYGKHLNRATEEENVEFLMRTGSDESKLQRALSETFRTGYSLGLISAAIIALHNEKPEPLE